MTIQKAWNGGSREEAIKAANRRRDDVRNALHAKHNAALNSGLLNPFQIDSPFTDDTYPGWIYLPIDDCVIMAVTAELLVSNASLWRMR